MNTSPGAYYVQLRADQGLPNSQIEIARLIRKGCGIAMNRSKAAHYSKLAADQLRYANCVLAGDGIKTTQGEVEHYLQRVISQGSVQAHMRPGRFDHSRARIEFNQVAPQNYFRASLSGVLSRPVDKGKVMKDHHSVPITVRLLLTSESHDILIMHVLNESLSVYPVVKSAVGNAWYRMPNDALGYLGDLKDRWKRLGSLPRQ
jgi:hypothetical protein